MNKAQKAVIKAQKAHIEFLQTQSQFQKRALAASLLRNSALEAASELHDSMKAQASRGNITMIVNEALFLKSMVAIITENQYDYAPGGDYVLNEDEVNAHVNACNVEVAKLRGLIAKYQS